MAVPVRAELMAWVREQEARLSRGAAQGVARRQQRLTDLGRLLPRPETLLGEARQRLDRADEGLARGLQRMVERKRAGLSEVSAVLRPGALKARLASERDRLDQRARQLRPALKRGVARLQDRLEARAGRLRPEPLGERMRRGQIDLDRHAAALKTGIAARLVRLSERLEAADRMRQTLGYRETLERGFAVVRTGGRVVTGAEAARGKSLEIEFRDGRVSAVSDDE